MRRLRLGVALLAAALLAACSGGSGGSGGSLDLGSSRLGGQGGTAGSSGTPAQSAMYGYGARTTGVDYQPDVVVVGGGPGRIRAVSDDGLMWTIDRDAPGASRLRLGAVMLMTSVAAGRVVALRDDGSTRVVTLAPVELTDVLRNGRISLKQAVDASAVTFQPVPGLAAVVSTAPSGAPPSPSGGHSFVDAPHIAVGGSLPPPSSATGTFAIGNFKVKPSFSTNGKIGASVEYTGSSGLKLVFDLAFLTHDLSVDGNLDVSDGVLSKPSFVLDGVTGFQVSFAAGVAQGGVDNGKATLILPGEFKYPIPPSPATGGLPLTFTVKYKLSVSTALTGKNSTLTATGKYKLDGPIGFQGAQILTPGFSVEKSLLDSVSGITLGPSGIVVALNFKTQVGLGTPLLNAGPNDGFTISVGVTNGSSLGAPLARCRGATLDFEVTGGVSVNVDSSIIAVLKNVLPAKTKLEFGVELKKTVLHRAQVLPDVALCRG